MSKEENAEDHHNDELWEDLQSAKAVQHPLRRKIATDIPNTSAGLYEKREEISNVFDQE